MVYQVSPGVLVQEIDLTGIVPSVSSTIGAFAGDFDWGPINYIMDINNETQLVRYFFKPSANTFKSFFTAANFLSYGDSLKLVRAANTSVAKNATNGSDGLMISNKDYYETNYQDLSAANTYGMFAAKYAGADAYVLQVFAPGYVIVQVVATKSPAGLFHVYRVGVNTLDAFK